MKARENKMVGDKVTGVYYKTRSDGVKLYRFAVPNIKNEETGEWWPPKFIIKQDQTGIEYTEAIDVENAPYTYTETDKQIDGGTTYTETQQKADALDHLTGGNYE